MMNPADLLRSVQESSYQISWPFPSWQDFRKASTFTQINYTNLVLLVLVLAYAVYQAWSKNAQADKAGRGRRYLPSPDFPPVEPLADFDYTKAEPVQIWPFKPKFNLTMALESLDPNELLLMDKNYRSRLAYRSRILDKYPDDVCGVVADDAAVAPAVRELYTYLLGTYLPVRFPRMFKLHETHYETGKKYMLENLVTGHVYPASPISPTTSSTLSLLQTLCKTLDEDFFFLLPAEPSKSDEESETEAKYHLHAFVCCCPAGFSPRAKLGLPLADIHAPVPGYPAILRASMDRFFARLAVGKYVKRVNWTITTHGQLYASPRAQGEDNVSTHGHKGDEAAALADVDPAGTFVRVERQTLHRLPASRAIVFAFKTYLYPLDQVKAQRGPEGAEQLAQAVDGITQGNVPGMFYYRRSAVWGEAVKRYLRS